uniref:Uncharacterized protein n=1 Tax=Arundo donax TaxID=35708 RepID=A0A0A8Y2I0_ARUDO
MIRNCGQMPQFQTFSRKNRHFESKSIEVTSNLVCGENYIYDQSCNHVARSNDGQTNL